MAQQSPSRAEGRQVQQAWEEEQNQDGDAGESNEMLKRLRALLKFAANRSESGTPDPDVRKNELTQLVRWKQLFLKFDSHHTGGLNWKQMGQLIRVSLRLSDRVLPTQDLHVVLHALDSDEDGFITFADFAAFLKGSANTAKKMDENTAKAVGRAVRLALRRNNLSLNNIRRLVDPPVDDSGHLGVNELKDFFRHDLGITKNESSDRSILGAYRVLMKTDNVNLTKDELFEFVRAVWQEGEGISNLDGDAGSAIAGPRLMKGLVGSMRDVRKQCRDERPRSGPSGMETIAFRGLGRSRPPADRLSSASGLPTPASSRPQSQQSMRPASSPSASRPGTGDHGLDAPAAPGSPSGLEQLQAWGFEVAGPITPAGGAVVRTASRASMGRRSGGARLGAGDGVAPTAVDRGQMNAEVDGTSDGGAPGHQRQRLSIASVGAGAVGAPYDGIPSLSLGTPGQIAGKNPRKLATIDSPSAAGVAADRKQSRSTTAQGLLAATLPARRPTSGQTPQLGRSQTAPASRDARPDNAEASPAVQQVVGDSEAVNQTKPPEQAQRGSDPKDRSGSGPKNAPAPEGKYLWMFGAHSLNRVEHRLYDAGVDVRGGFYRPSLFVQADEDGIDALSVKVKATQGLLTADLEVALQKKFRQMVRSHAKEKALEGDC